MMSEHEVGVIGGVCSGVTGINGTPCSYIMVFNPPVQSTMGIHLSKYSMYDETTFWSKRYRVSADKLDILMNSRNKFWTRYFRNELFVIQTLSNPPATEKCERRRDLTSGISPKSSMIVLDFKL